MVATIEGTLQLVWGDPPEAGVPQYRAFVTTEAGESVEIEPLLSRDLTAGDLVALNGRRVRVRGTATAMRLTPLSQTAQPFQALAIAPVSDAAFSAITAKGFSSRCLRRRSSATAAALRASQASW